MNARTIATIALAAALALASAVTRARDWDDVSQLVSHDGSISCPGTRYWLDGQRRGFWTEGRTDCPLTYVQCTRAYVHDQDGMHKVTSCSPDSDWSEGRKATYK